MTYGGGGFGGDLNLKAQLVNGVCPHCHNSVVFVSLCKDFFRCMACGADLEQKVNGKISYIPAVLSKENIKFETGSESKKI